MNTELKTAFDRVAALPEVDQIRFAHWLQAELDDERHWQEQFSANPSVLLKLAEAAIEEDDRGETKPWPVNDE